MKRTKVANYLKTGILFLGISFLLWNCEKEEHIHQENKFSIKKINFDKALKKEKVKNIYEKIVLEKESNYSGKSIETSYDFKIIETSVKEIVTDEAISYTFYVERENNDDSYIENLIISVPNNGDKPIALLNKYSLSEPMQLSVHNSFSFNGSMESEFLDYDKIDFSPKETMNQICVINRVVYCTNGGYESANGAYYSDNHVAGMYCTLEGYLYTVEEEVCTDSPGGDPIKTDSDSDSSDNTNNPHGNGTTTTAVTTSITAPSLEDTAKSDLHRELSLSPEQSQWVNNANNINGVIAIWNFGKLNNWSQDALIPINELLLALSAGINWDFSTHIDSIDLINTGVSLQEIYPDDPILGNQILLNIGNAAVDGLGNLILIYAEFALTDEEEGYIIRKLLPKLHPNLLVQGDISNESLGELFQIRKRNRTIALEFQGTLTSDLIDTAISTFDVLAIISPSKGGGAYLLANGGQSVTFHALSNLLNSLKNSIYKLRGPMVGKKIGHTYKVHGSHLTDFSKMRAINGNSNIGQWLDDAAAESFIAKHLSQLNNGAIDIPIPTSIQDIGKIFRAGDAVEFPPTHIRLVPSGSGVKTAYPINSTLTTLNNTGIYVP